MAHFSDTVILTAFKDPLFGARFSTISLFYKPSYSEFSVNILKFSLPWQQGVGLE